MSGFDSFEFNKIAGAVLGTLLLVFALSEVANFIMYAKTPETPGFAVEVAEAPAAGAEAAPAAEVVPIAKLLQTASAEKGQAVAKACAACHDLSSANANKVGPGLWNIVDQQIAHHEGFAYSDALKAKAGEKWTWDNLNAFLANPKGFAPGTKMSYAGVKKDDARADLLAYLRTLADSPVALPPAP
jgi:cytochrome c